MYTKIVCAGKIPQSEETLEQVIVVLSRWQRQAKGDSSSLSSLGPKWLQTSPQPPKVSNINAIKWKPKNAHILKYKGGGDFLLWWGLINHSGLGYLSCASRLLRDLRWKPAHCSFFCLFLPLDTNMRKITGSRFQIPETTAWLDASFGLASCLGMEAVLNHKQLRVCAREVARGLGSKPELITATDKSDAEKLRAKNFYLFIFLNCIFSPKTAADSKRSQEFAWQRDDGRKWWRELRRNHAARCFKRIGQQSIQQLLAMLFSIVPEEYIEKKKASFCLQIQRQKGAFLIIHTQVRITHHHHHITVSSQIKH